jgi:carboxymethylenebutenolidase
VVASYGGRDRRLKGAAARLKGALERNNIDHDVKEYPDAGHSFLDDHKGLIGVLGVVIGATYKDKDAADARAASRRSSRAISPNRSEPDHDHSH